MLEIDEIDVFYGDLQALWGVSFVIHEREIVAILGSNGAGKSTTLKTLAGLLRPAKGRMSFCGVTVNNLAANKRVQLGICLVPEGRGLFSGMSVLENLELGAFNLGARKARGESLKLVYEMFPVLEKRKKQPARTLSGGEQQMLAMGRGLMSKPKLLLLDEPSLGLAPLVIKVIFGAIEQTNKSGVTIVLVEQNTVMSLRMANRAHIIESGRIVQHGDAESLLHDEKVKDAYLGTGSA